MTTEDLIKNTVGALIGVIAVVLIMIPIFAGF